MKISVLTLFPEMFDVLNHSILGRARSKNIIEIELIDIRRYSENKHSNADDYPFGGGAGMVLMPQPIFTAFDRVFGPDKPYTVYMSPKGRKLTQQKALELSKLPRLCIICGHYEGVDQRVIDSLVDEEISIGDYIFTGGELPAIVLIDCVSRLIPGVLSGESLHDESLNDNLLEYPHYTQPAEFRGMKVPDVLLSGNHAEIEKWRRRQRLLITAKLRPDLLQKAELDEDDLSFLKQNGIDIR